MTSVTPPSTPPDVLVLHGPGAPEGAGPWRGAFAAAGWPGRVLAPDLPGHGTEPAPLGGSYEQGDAVLFAVRLLAERDSPGVPPVVVGEAGNGWAATVLALAGRATALVLVDGLGGPWRTPIEVLGRGRDLLRAIADDEAAVASAPSSGLDPRLRHGLPSHGSRFLAEQSAAELSVPVLLVESSKSGLSQSDLAALIPSFSSPVTTVVLPAPSPAEVVSAMVGWTGRFPVPMSTSP
ncbi:MAG: hypothetical protein AVDCRST_MAG50-927 [uncultured Acidimicrobiales bacterium]|uniref:AB hydrolase-1 domain-containing protein n=1 Tax=uncultured Acidimicrobiales bacterium TaxID=310071 RepID=A0A6J4H081_9ACTN|nr:MAG: hypothetical protein AVDCRST_MAG50-927 [uncultured Acidimicrobiales bacterium]